MLAKTLSIIVANWWFYLLFALLMLVVFAIADAGYTRAATGATITIPWLIFARFVHRSALFDVRFNAPNPDGMSDNPFHAGFVLKGLALLFASIVLAFPFILLPKAQKLTETQAPEISDILPFGIALVVIYVAVLSLAGSWLPAAVYGRNKGLGAALRRGAKTFFRVFPWIALTLVGTIAVELALFVPQALLKIDPAVVRNDSLNVEGAFFQMVRILIEAASITLTSVVLSHYYLEYERSAQPA